MSYRVKFSITIISLIVLVILGIFLFNTPAEYVTIKEFNNQKEVYNDGKKIIIGGKVAYANDIRLPDKLYIDDKKRYAIFNITDSTGLYVKIIYNEEKSEKVDFTVGDNVIVTGEYYQSSNTHTVSDEYAIAKNLNHVIVSSSLQTKCDSKYSEDKQ
tara:strand:- start:99 stop:569 length:471 start_codon:yes stop_codon:yes gene_type:complete